MATVFEVSGPFAMYRKPYTTTSSVSFPIPPPTAVAGLLAAILGMDNGGGGQSCAAAYWPALAGTRIAIQRLNATAWFSTTINFSNTKDPQKSPHIRVKHQFVKDPHFRIFVQGGIETRLREMLAAGEFIYTPTLGIASAIADITYCGAFEFDGQAAPVGKEVAVASALPLQSDQQSTIDFLKTGGILQDAFPFRLDGRRALQETLHLLYPSSPSRRIVLTVWPGLEVTRYDDGDTWIAWLPAW